MGILGALGLLSDGVGTVLLEGKQAGGWLHSEVSGEPRGTTGTCSPQRIFFTIAMSMPELFPEPGGPMQQGWHVRKISEA